MVQNHDFVYLQWPSTNPEDSPNEGFRSKPVLSFWLMSAGLSALGVGGYSGAMVEDARTMLAIRLPFVLCAVGGLALLWWMLARLVSRRLAWLALLVVGSCPFMCLIARQGIPDMPLTACVIGALSLFTMAVEDGERPVATLGAIRIGRRTLAWDARHIVLGLVGGAVIAQAIYYAIYFALSPQLAVFGAVVPPALLLPLLMLASVAALHRDGWLIVRMPSLLIGGIVAAIVNAPIAAQAPGQTRWRHVFDDVLRIWDRYALDRLVVRIGVFLAVPVAAGAAIWLPLTALDPGHAQIRGLEVSGGVAVIWTCISVMAPGRWPLLNWREARRITERLLAMSPITTMRQLYLFGCYSLLGISVLAKGPPGLAVVGAVGVFHVLLRHHWRALYDGAFELKRGILIMLGTFLPWHAAMFLKDGLRFIDEYVFNHVVNRAAVGVDNSPGTFEYYTSQIGHGMWLWAALVPAAVVAAMLRSRTDTREGRVRFMIGLWAIAGVAFFSLVQTKFHHYILPVVPALGILVAFFLDDLIARRDRLHPIHALIGAAIALLICRDLMHEPERWIEMFVFRYDRPWPGGEPWQIDPSDGFFALGIAAALAILVAATRWCRFGVGSLCVVGLAICVWSLQVYMPLAGTHWGMREAVRTYYDQRTIYGEKLVYYSAAQLRAEWSGVTDSWTFDSFVPSDLSPGQPMTLTIELRKPDNEQVVAEQLQLTGAVSALGGHRITVKLFEGERQKLQPLIDAGARAAAARHPPIHAVDADRLVVWQLYWRGEQFWSGGEIWAELPEMKTTFQATNNTRFNKYVSDRVLAPVGRRYFFLSEAGRIAGLRSMLPTPRARDTFQVLDTTSNKFSLAAATF
jgi:4-amino-4-deoxy-L-arabinose transferase-like glycosyltransferase